MGERIISANGILTAFDPAQREIIEKAIRYHNKKSLPSGESEAVLFHTKLIRDADKLDIYRVVTGRAEFAGGLPLQETISESLIEDLLAGKLVDYQRLQNSTEMRLMHINWIFDINFEPTLRLIRERNYLDILSAMLPAHDRIQAFVHKARRRLWNHIPPPRFYAYR